MIRVAIAIPSRGQHPARFTLDLAHLVMVTSQHMAAGNLAFSVILGEHTYIDSNRNELVAAAIESDATHILWLDDDMRFPHDTLVRLLQHSKPVVGANYARRSVADPRPTAILKVGDRKTPGELLYGAEDASGLVEVEALGFGCVLTQIGVFGEVGAPWFEKHWDKTLRQDVGEDADFCARARKKGVAIYVDQALSEEVEHLGVFGYRLAHARMARDEKKE